MCYGSKRIRKSLSCDLIESGKAKGKLTTKEITDALEELDFDVEQVDKLYDTAGIARTSRSWTTSTLMPIWTG